MNRIRIILLSVSLSLSFLISAEEPIEVENRNSQAAISLGYGTFFNTRLYDYYPEHQSQLEKHMIVGASYSYFFNRTFGLGVKTSLSYGTDKGSTGTYGYGRDGELKYKALSYFVGPSLVFKNMNYIKEDRLKLYLTPGYLINVLKVDGNYNYDVTNKAYIWGGDAAIVYAFDLNDSFSLGVEISYFLGKLYKETYTEVEIISSGYKKGETYIREYDFPAETFGKNFVSQFNVSICFGLNL